MEAINDSISRTLSDDPRANLTNYFARALSDVVTAGQILDNTTIEQAVLFENACNPIIRSSAR